MRQFFLAPQSGAASTVFAASEPLAHGNTGLLRGGEYISPYAVRRQPRLRSLQHQVLDIPAATVNSRPSPTMLTDSGESLAAALLLLVLAGPWMGRRDSGTCNGRARAVHG